jgi:uncharacterized protein YdaU (DUF1376 family)
MNFYKHHIGDYAQATSHLSFVEDAAYSRLIRKYYAEESPLPAEKKSVQRLVGARTKEERQAVSDMLDEFFELRDDGWHNTRCDREIEAAEKKAEKNREVGKSGGRPRKTQTDEVSKKNHDGLETEPKNNPSQTPDSRLQTPEVALSQVQPVLGETPPEPNATSLEAPQPEKPIDAAATTRKGELCRKLRSLGFDAAPHLDAWAEILRGHSDDEIMAVAETARERKPGERLHLNYLLPMLRDKAAPKPTKAKEPPWWSSESAMLAKGKELGMAPWGGESWQQFRGRIDAKLAERAAA